MIAEDYVSLETAKLLKEKGFDEATLYDYSDRGLRWFNGVLAQHNSQGGTACPTLQMAMKWLREVHNLFIQVTIVPHTTVTIGQDYYVFAVCKDRRNLAFIRSDHPHDCYSTYEEACEAGVRYCLENLI